MPTPDELLAKFVKLLEDLRSEMKADLAVVRSETLARFDNIELTLRRLDDFPDNLQRLNKMVLDQNTDSVASLNKMASDLSANTIATKEMRSVVDNIAALMKFGRGTANFFSWLGKIAVGFGLVYAAWLWLTGRGGPPFPPNGQ
jgi:hypothetical protein